ncbi:hypothetical protein TcWFU_010387 [Taenia crassiceps]|uniref:Secreted protein n=1 Tax=Taenia crassiceps TaxID=6207 RepID=A0ABR4PYW3_9CEST
MALWSSTALVCCHSTCTPAKGLLSFGASSPSSTPRTVHFSWKPVFCFPIHACSPPSSDPTRCRLFLLLSYAIRLSTGVYCLFQTCEICAQCIVLAVVTSGAFTHPPPPPPTAAAAATATTA